MKRVLTLLIALAILTGLSACRPGTPDESRSQGGLNETVELTLWTYPVGDWNNPTTMASLLSGFRQAYPNIHIDLKCVDYITGDAEIEDAIAQGKADLVFEGPERLSANWGERGLMADLSDLWDTPAGGEIVDVVRRACISNDGNYYILPICMTAQCMAVNRDLFQAAGALQYLDEETRTWTTDGFCKAVAALREYGIDTAVEIYCGGSGGDQGTRVLVNSLCGGTFTDAEHTRYTVESPENIQALQLLYDLEGVEFTTDQVGSQAIDRFCRGETAMILCWNGSVEVTHTVSSPDMNFDVLPMAFPSPTGQPSLQGGIWGLGVFDNGDPAKVEAAKTFIRYMTEDNARYTRAVRTANFWPVREVEGIYDNDVLMTEYSLFTEYLGDYYQITPNWVAARDAWWRMLQKVANGTDPAQAAREFSAAMSAVGS